MAHRHARAATALGAALLTLLATLSCATSGAKRKEEARLKKARSHYDLGRDHLSQGRTALALRELLAAERYDPRNAQTQYALGEGYLRKGKLEESEAHLRRALELYSDYHDARLSLSALYMQQERYPEAIAQMEILIDDPTFPAPWRALNNLGWSQLKLGRTAEARSAFEQAREYHATYWTTLLNLGILEAMEGHRSEAIVLFQELLALDPDPSMAAEVNFRLAEIYVSLGKHQRAVGHLKTAIAQMPGTLWGKKSEEYLRLLR